MGDATWRSQICTAVDGTETYATEALLDIKKAFENVKRQILMEMGIKMGYPLTQLIMSRRANQGKRRIRLEGMVTNPCL